MAISGANSGTGGFISIPGGAYTADPRSQVRYLGATAVGSPADIPGFTYDHIHDAWLPVPRQWVTADFARYVYPTQDHAVHLVDTATGADSVLPGGDALSGYLIAVEPDGVYGVPSPLTLRRVDWQGRMADVIQGYYANTIVVGAGVAYGSAESGAVHSIDRIDLTTGTSQLWFRSLTKKLRVVGLDGSGNPVITGVAANGTVSIWNPTSASTSDEPVGQALGSFPYDPGTVTVVQGQGGFWVESTVFGLYHNDVAVPNSFGLASSRTGYIAGPCF